MVGHKLKNTINTFPQHRVADIIITALLYPFSMEIGEIHKMSSCPLAIVFPILAMTIKRYFELGNEYITL